MYTEYLERAALVFFEPAQRYFSNGTYQRFAIPRTLPFQGATSFFTELQKFNLNQCKITNLQTTTALAVTMLWNDGNLWVNLKFHALENQ